MTQNDIAYYNARNERRDNRLRRKETKRHNEQMEKLQHESNVASQLGAEARYISALASQAGAQASQMSAAAAAQQAKTRQAEYELEWSQQYGWPYGTSESVMNSPLNYSYFDVNRGDYVSWDKVDNYSRAGDVIVTVPNTYTPVSYMNNWFGLALTEQNIKTGKATEEKTNVQKYESATSTAGKLIKVADTVISWFK